MKTLVIHPEDITTKFLSIVYEDTNWNIIDYNVSKRELKENIKSHDRIIMLGHGSEQGLFGYKRLVIHSNLVYLLRDKICYCVWCNADVFFNKYGLHGFCTGMIVSEIDEAEQFINYPYKEDDINKSNELFSINLKYYISNNKYTLNSFINSYNSICNEIIKYNRQNLYEKTN